MQNVFKKLVPKHHIVIYGLGVVSGIGLTLLVCKDYIVFDHKILHLVGNTGLLDYMRANDYHMDFSTPSGTFVLTAAK